MMKIFGNDRGSAAEHNDKHFDWSEVPVVDPDEVERWMGVTDAKDRQFPLQVALQVHDELEYALMAPGKMEALRMSEIRGGLMALTRFARLYNEIMRMRKTDA